MDWSREKRVVEKKVKMENIFFQFCRKDLKCIPVWHVSLFTEFLGGEGPRCAIEWLCLIYVMLILSCVGN